MFILTLLDDFDLKNFGRRFSTNQQKELLVSTFSWVSNTTSKR